MCCYTYINCHDNACDGSTILLFECTKKVIYIYTSFRIGSFFFIGDCKLLLRSKVFKQRFSVSVRTCGPLVEVLKCVSFGNEVFIWNYKLLFSVFRQRTPVSPEKSRRTLRVSLDSRRGRGSRDSGEGGGREGVERKGRVKVE